MNVLQLIARSIYLMHKCKGNILPKLPLTLVLYLFITVASSAQTRYYVNQSIANSGDGKTWGAAFKTLQEGINTASSSVADEIWVAKGTYIPNTNFYGTRYDAPQYSTSMTFFLKKPIKIYGGFVGTETALTQRNWEVNETILSGNIRNLADSTDNIYHVLLIMGKEASPLENVTVDGFTISDGYANVQTSSIVDGIAVYAYNGGGIYNIYASPELKNLKIKKNVGFVGGGIHNKNSSPVIDNCQILQNYSGSSGAGIYNLNGNPLIQNTLISDNTVNNIGGGGIDNASSNTTVKNSIIRNNRASKGGGIYSDGGNIILEKVLIENNRGNIDGGGLYNFSNTNLTMKHVTVTGNRAQYGGGMRTFRATLQIDSSRFSNNTADYYGGGMYSDGDNIQFSHSNIDSNKATTYQGGGLFMEKAVVSIKGGTIKGNSAKTDAGGILFRSNSYGSFEEVEISKNISPRNGGGIYLTSNTDPTQQFQFTRVTFENNEAFAGGGIYLNITSPTFDNVNFKGNITADAGAGLMVAASCYPDLKNCVFEKNKAMTGGGLFSQNGSVLTINNSSFLENEAENYGGGIYCGGISNYNRVTIKGNKAKDGGGISLQGAAILTNVLITGNYASGKGGGIYMQRAAPVLTNITVAGNNAIGGGGGIYSDNSNTSKVRNSIIYGNNSAIGGYPQFAYSFVEGSTAVTNGNIPGSVDPGFIEPQPFANAPFITGNYFLKVTSPVIDKGDNSFFVSGSNPDLSTITTDLLGNTRFYNTMNDLGAYEYQPGIVLPLKLVSFDVLLQNNSVNVSWKTMDEVNVSHFEIERSTDGISFAKVGVHQANGSGSYHFNDANLPVGNIYYRLKTIDIDGESEFSTVKLAKDLNLNDAGILIYPIPSNGLIYITDRNKTLIKGSFSILTTTGQKIMQTYSNPININSLVPGMYYFKVTDASGKLIVTRAIIKQ